MKPRRFMPVLGPILLCLLAAMQTSRSEQPVALTGASTNAPATAALAPAAAAPPASGVTDEQFRRLEEQLTGLQKAEDNARTQSEAASRENSALTERLATLEKTLIEQRQQEIEAVRSANRFGFIALTVSSGAALLAILVTIWFQNRCLNRCLELAARFPSLSDPRQLGEGSSNTRLLGAIETLERRIRQLEQTGGKSSAEKNAPLLAEPRLAESAEPPRPAPSHSPQQEAEIALLMAKGQTLLDLDKPQESLVCFDEVISLHPHHTESHLKRAVALERLKAFDQSLSAYDDALKLDPEMTIAYLYKGRVLQELQRYNEALACYERALNRNALDTATPSTVAA